MQGDGGKCSQLPTQFNWASLHPQGGTLLHSMIKDCGKQTQIEEEETILRQHKGITKESQVTFRLVFSCSI